MFVISGCGGEVKEKLEKSYEFALDKEYESYGVLKQKGYSESYCREQDLKRQLKVYKVFEERIGMPLDKFLGLLLQDNCLYGIIGNEVEEVEVGFVSANFYFDNGKRKNDVRLHDTNFSDCGYSTETFNEYFFLDETEAEKAFGGKE